MSDAILVVNAGSSSIKLSLFLVQAGGGEQVLGPLLGGQIEGL
jgi:acetate kinase